MRWTACSPGLSSRSRLTRTRPATSTGSSRSTPPSSAPTSTLPPPAEKGDPPAGRTGRSRPRPIPRRPDHQNPSRLRRQGTPTRGSADTRPTPGQHLRASPPGTHPCPRTGQGRPRCRPDQVIADKAYSSRGFRAYLRKRGIACTIPERADQQRHRHNRGRHGGRPPAFDRHIYRRRNVVERCFNRLKGFRGIATRYDKTATSYEAAVSLASFLLWARSVEDGL